MNTLTLMVWSIALGAIAAVGLARICDMFVRPGLSQVRALGFHAAVFLLVLVESGVLKHVAHPGPERLRILQVLAGPLCVALSNFWIHSWLSAGERDRLMALALRASALGLPLLALAALAAHPRHQLPIAALLSVTGGALTCWITFRAWTIGDRLAGLMAWGCLLTVPAIGGLYALAMGSVRGLGWHAAVAGVTVLCNALTGYVLWRRMLRRWRTRETGRVPAIDPLTRVYSSTALVQRLVQAQKRRRRTRREGALLAITVFDPDRLLTLAGPAGMNEVWMTLAARVQRELGAVNPVGRYWDRCFVALVETIPTRSWLRTTALRVAASLREPLEVTGRDGEPVRVRLDFGLGAVPLHALSGEVEDLLDEAQRLAEAGRGLRSRAATTDPLTGEAVAVEEARFAQRPLRVRPLRVPAGLPSLQPPAS
ncbi:MAG TPA: hypothetical protein VHL79_18865 [Ramlibacter sp.]|jgi:GGDEF domain-containing protein|nr:hypothetical protein [Ramlibacter sp.]